MTDTTPTIREQLLAAREHVVAASAALNQITAKLRRARDMDHEDDAWHGVLLLADVIGAIDLLLMTEIGS